MKNGNPSAHFLSLSLCFPHPQASHRPSPALLSPHHIFASVGGVPLVPRWRSRRRPWLDPSRRTATMARSIEEAVGSYARRWWPASCMCATASGTPPVVTQALLSGWCASCGAQPPHLVVEGSPSGGSTQDWGPKAAAMARGSGNSTRRSSDER